MAAYSSILSCGVRLRKALLNSAQFRKLTDRVFPVVSRVDEKKPFVSFHRAETIQGENMDGRPPREGYFQFQVYTAEWEEGVEIAEAIVATLNGWRDDAIRFCSFEAASEDFDDRIPAFVQILTFRVKTN